MAKATKSKKKPIDQYDRKGKKRLNNPPVGLITPETDKETGQKKSSDGSENRWEATARRNYER